MEIKKVIYNVSDILRGSFPYQMYSDICVYCVFLKYILDNKKLPYDKALFDLQRIFDLAELNEEGLIDTSNAIEEKYGLPQSSLVDFAQNFIRFHNMQQSYNVTEKVLNILKEISFENQGKEIVEALKEILYSSASNFGRIMGEKITSKSLSDLIKELIEIRDEDCYADFAYGIGISSLEIIGDKKCSITGYELNRSSIAVAEMLLIILGKENFNLIQRDVLDINIKENSLDKIVTMPPFGARVREFSASSIDILEKFNLPQKQLNIDTLILLKALAALRKDGTVVMTVTPNFLFSNTVMDKEIRKLIVKNNLKAVIQLPNLYYGTGISTVILVLSKHRQTNTVLFVDAGTNEYFPFFDKTSRPISNLTETGIAKIKELYQDAKSEEGVSCVATTEEIEKNDFLLTLVKYIKVKINRETISNEEIDKRLKELYRELKDILEG